MNFLEKMSDRDPLFVHKAFTVFGSLVGFIAAVVVVKKTSIEILPEPEVSSGEAQS